MFGFGNMTAQRIRIIWLIGFAGLMGWLVWLWLIPNGIWTTTRVFPDSNRQISEFYPAARVAELIDVNTSLSTRSIINEPVYMKVRVPRNFSRVAVKIDYEHEGDLLWRLGVREKLNDWQWRIVEPFTEIPLDGIPLQEGAYEFIISMPGQEGSLPPLVIRGLSFAFFK